MSQIKGVLFTKKWFYMSTVKYEISLYTKRLCFVFLVHRGNLQHMWNAWQDVGPSKGCTQICEGEEEGERGGKKKRRHSGSEETTPFSNKWSMCSGSPGGFVRGSRSACARIPLNQTGVKVKWCPEDAAPSHAISSLTTWQIWSQPSTTAEGFAKGFRCQMLRESILASLAPLGHVAAAGMELSL